jgi:anti-anti-sigma factor
MHLSRASSRAEQHHHYDRPGTALRRFEVYLVGGFEILLVERCREAVRWLHQRQVELTVSPVPPVTLLFCVTPALGDRLVDGSNRWSRMHRNPPGLPIDARAAGRATPRSGRDTLSRPPPTSLEPRWTQPDRGHLTSGGDTVAGRHQPIVAGQLAVRWDRQDDMLIMWLTGALDQATVSLLDRELDGQAVGMMRLVVDLTALEFIDSPGLDALVGIHWRASKRGDQLSFRHGPCVADRPVELTRTIRLRSRWAPRPPVASDENPYCALAVACVNVDHPWSGDRPEAA